VARLTNKQRIFVEEYLRCWNATEAAKRAGYSPRTAYRTGADNIKKPQIEAEIKARIAEKAMSADEVLLRLGEQARAEYAAYLHENGTVDLARMLRDGKGHLVKGTKWDRRGNLIVEFHDTQAALVQVGRHLKLFTDSIEHSGQVKIDDYREDLERRLSGLIGRGQTEGVSEQSEPG